MLPLALFVLLMSSAAAAAAAAACCAAAWASPETPPVDDAPLQARAVLQPDQTRPPAPAAWGAGGGIISISGRIFGGLHVRSRRRGGPRAVAGWQAAAAAAAATAYSSDVWGAATATTAAGAVPAAPCVAAAAAAAAAVAPVGVEAVDVGT